MEWVSNQRVCPVLVSQDAPCWQFVLYRKSVSMALLSSGRWHRVIGISGMVWSITCSAIAAPVSPAISSGTEALPTAQAPSQPEQPGDPAKLAPPLAPAPLPEPTTPPETPPPTLPVTKVEVLGSTIFTPADFQPIVQSVEGKSVSLEELRQVADAITQLYLDRGYITSRAILVDQTVKEGVVQFQVIEGSLERIELDGNFRVRPSYIRDRIMLGGGTPLNRDKLEDQLRLLKLNPLFSNVEASLRPGSELGQSILVVRVTEVPALTGLIGVDNYSPPAVGSIRLGGIVNLRNPSGLGDDLLASFYGTTAGGSNIFDLVYRVPVNAMDGAVRFRFSPSNSRIVDDDFSALGIEGNSQLYDLNFRQPIIRNPREEFALSLGFTVQNGQTFLFNDIGFPFGFGPSQDGNSRTRVLNFSQDYVKRDPFGAWVVRSQFNFGLNILDATTNPSPIPDGEFFSWQGQLQRVQRFGSSSLFIAQADIQLTPDSLLPFNQFVLGGGQSLLGYRQNVRSGDNGFLITLENRFILTRDEGGRPLVLLAPFLQGGGVWNNPDNPNQLPPQTFLGDIGVGLLLQPTPKFSLRLDGAIPFVQLRDRGNNLQDYGVYFTVNYQP